MSTSCRQLQHFITFPLVNPGGSKPSSLPRSSLLSARHLPVKFCRRLINNGVNELMLRCTWRNKIEKTPFVNLHSNLSTHLGQRTRGPIIRKMGPKWYFFRHVTTNRHFYHEIFIELRLRIFGLYGTIQIIFLTFYLHRIGETLWL